MTNLRPAFLALAALPTAALAQKSTFDIVAEGKKVGTETYTIAKAKGGYQLDGRLRLRMSGNDAEFVDDFKYSDTYAFLTGTITNQNTLTMTSLVPDKARKELAVANFQGHAGHDSLMVEIKPDLVVLPPFDPGSAQQLLSMALTHPPADGLYNVFVPIPGGGGGGRGGGGGGRRGGGGGAPAGAETDTQTDDGSMAHDAKWFKGKDSGGTLDGKPVLLHTYMLAYGRNRYYFYADTTDQLMQLNVASSKASYVRANFKLNATSPAPAPGASTAEPTPKSNP